ncbi:aminotransferase class I/II-fold pyridoxal phosphate-dependent enzyme [Paraburkholderia bannensis]|uniref:aminotransferase class I/II-fold pyridoxal phosphate-dependent enzyme n=1 Tax=Paraburkholderia bannensis TaxID=765414 RepID=UPI000A036EC5|nr:aminotransferase class I/II-fold pyridoxal phosphate-dependent enzyme [Paraburkholderia bannensis]
MATRGTQQRPDKAYLASLAFDSQAVHGGNLTDTTAGAIRTPIVMANSYRLPDDPTSLDWSDAQTLFYTRNRSYNQLCLERKLAAMERGEDAVVFSTGVAALHAIFFTFLKSGDHVVVSDVTYEAVWRILRLRHTGRACILRYSPGVTPVHALKARRNELVS